MVVIRDETWQELAARIAGRLVRPGDAGYDEARALQIREFDTIRPAGVVYCTGVDDVRAAVLFARTHALAVAPRSGGHSSAGYSTTEGLVIDVTGIADVRRDGTLIRAGAGIQTIDLLEETAPGGWVIPAGTCATVGLAGLTLGGGIGIATRKYGLTCDRVREMQVVLADGSVVTCDDERHADLFWALRGCGGGNLGIVTELVLEAVPATPVTSYSLSWDWSAAPHVWAAWQQWAPHAPDDLASNVRFALEHPQAGTQPQVMVLGAWLGDPGELPALLDDLRQRVGRAPEAEFLHTDSYYDTLRTWMGCAELTRAQAHRVGTGPEATLPRDGWHRERGHFVPEPIPAEGIEQILAAFADAPAGDQIRALELGAMGGACNRIPSDATAFVHRDQLYYAGLVVEAHDEITDELRASGSAWIDSCQPVLRRWSSPHTYQNLPDPALIDWRTAYYGANQARLAEIAHRYDPDGFFGRPQSLSAPQR
ncbi:FAD-binding oxidoreductase [Nocardia sp. 2]|uniref:FAD-binding oxidoreductase n=1 Tax=Nocardia acididurans TaxID=2802282 RepID=A0ABS1MKP9_9NOCA|nr:FAD-binding oxidoreductase [Nocardia acididurans]MBL1080229.1 FAD-binding oxidoreductase [Nocardia acididurans]